MSGSTLPRPAAPAATAAEPVAETLPAGRPPRRRPRWSRALVWAGLAAASVVFLYPLVWLVSASLKPRPDVFDNRLVPRTWAPDNFVQVWDEIPLLTWLTNSIIVGFAAALAVTISSALVAWAFAFYRFPGRNVFFGLVLATMMLPTVVTLIPTYLVWNELGLATTQVPLWAQNLFGSAFYIFLLRQFFAGLPRELFEAAQIDGAGPLQMFLRLTVPMARPALVITFVLEFQASWTDLLKPLVYLRDDSLYTLPRGLKAVLDQFGQGGEMQWEIVLAANVIATLPMIVLFVLVGRWVTAGISFSGSKD